jgi:hypothetical protein
MSKPSLGFVPRTIFVSMLLLLLPYLAFADDTCGHYGQAQCSQEHYLIDYPYYYLEYFPCQDGTSANSQHICARDLSSWTQKPLDTTRPLKNGKNWWRWDDEDRDKLQMSRSALSHAFQITYGGAPLPNGRYIYVLNLAGQIWLSAYDRGDYPNNLSPANWRLMVDDMAVSLDPCSPNVSGCEYQHVRHSQLNEGWDPVYCAGEMRIAGGMIDRVNNESGHFRPPATCLQYVKSVLGWLRASTSPDVDMGDFETVKTGEPSHQLKGGTCDPKLIYVCVRGDPRRIDVCATLSDGTRTTFPGPGCACNAGAVSYAAWPCEPVPLDTDFADLLDSNRDGL